MCWLNEGVFLGRSGVSSMPLAAILLAIVSEADMLAHYRRVVHQINSSLAQGKAST